VPLAVVGSIPTEEAVATEQEDYLSLTVEMEEITLLLHNVLVDLVEEAEHTGTPVAVAVAEVTLVVLVDTTAAMMEAAVVVDPTTQEPIQ
jgi:hypothetical protein